MSYEPVEKLRLASRRAKSDVANKLISMCLHQLSRRLSGASGYRVEDQRYQEAVRLAFGDACPYCQSPFDGKSAIVEHLDGMNRLRAGLHVPGNVLLACKPCNNEKRRDDSNVKLPLAEFGWENFLSHDRTACPQNCKTCAYWEKFWPDPHERQSRLRLNRERIQCFRDAHLSPDARALSGRIAPRLQSLYARCQDFADDLINQIVEEVFAAREK